MDVILQKWHIKIYEFIVYKVNPMVKAAEKRKKIFDRFSTHLSELNKEGKLAGIELKHDNTYICPICLNQFSNADLKSVSTNMLTSEDSPPDCLGGKKVALTCKECNNRCGRELDFHLQEGLLEIDSREFLPYSTRKAEVTIGGVTVKGEIRVTEKSVEVHVSEKNNNPEVAKEHLTKVVPNEVATVKPKPSRVDPLKFEVALLKSAYILAFAKFGYNLFLDPCYDVVREQLNKPDQRIYPEGFFTKQPFTKEQEGIYFILEKGYESIFVILPVMTKSSTRRFGVALPLPNIPIEKVAGKLKEQDAGFGLTVEFMGGNEVDYLTNKEEVNKLNNLVRSINSPEPAAPK